MRLRIPAEVHLVRVRADLEHRPRSRVNRISLGVRLAHAHARRRGGPTVRAVLVEAVLLLRPTVASPTLILGALHLRFGCAGRSGSSHASHIDRLLFRLGLLLRGLHGLPGTLGLPGKVCGSHGRPLLGGGLCVGAGVVDERRRVRDPVTGPVVADKVLHVLLNFELLER